MRLYSALGLTPQATQREIRRAYHKRARECHPDRAGREGEAEYRRLSEAYSVLSDPRKRAVYDRHGDAGLDYIEGGGVVHEAGAAFGRGPLLAMLAGFAFVSAACLVAASGCLVARLDGEAVLSRSTWVATLWAAWTWCALAAVPAAWVACNAARRLVLACHHSSSLSSARAGAGSTSSSSGAGAASRPYPPEATSPHRPFLADHTPLGQLQGDDPQHVPYAAADAVTTAGSSVAQLLAVLAFGLYTVAAVLTCINLDRSGHRRAPWWQCLAPALAAEILAAYPRLRLASGRAFMHRAHIIKPRSLDAHILTTLGAVKAVWLLCTWALILVKFDARDVLGGTRHDAQRREERVRWLVVAVPSLVMLACDFGQQLVKTNVLAAAHHIEVGEHRRRIFGTLALDFVAAAGFVLVAMRLDGTIDCSYAIAFLPFFMLETYALIAACALVLLACALGAGRVNLDGYQSVTSGDDDPRRGGSGNTNGGGRHHRHHHNDYGSADDSTTPSSMASLRAPGGSSRSPLANPAAVEAATRPPPTHGVQVSRWLPQEEETPASPATTVYGRSVHSALSMQLGASSQSRSPGAPASSRAAAGHHAAAAGFNSRAARMGQSTVSDGTSLANMSQRIEAVWGPDGPAAFENEPGDGDHGLGEGSRATPTQSPTTL